MSKDHLEYRIPVGEDIRDNLRAELARYAHGSIMLDGVTTDQHYSVIVNSPYYLVNGTRSQLLDIEDETQLETLF